MSFRLHTRLPTSLVASCITLWMNRKWSNPFTFAGNTKLLRDLFVGLTVNRCCFVCWSKLHLRGFVPIFDAPRPLLDWIMVGLNHHFRLLNPFFCSHIPISFMCFFVLNPIHILNGYINFIFATVKPTFSEMFFARQTAPWGASCSQPDHSGFDCGWGREWWWSVR